jgi:hypothetical protein
VLRPGTTLGPYEILAPIGAGGMGEVYRARDTRLRRDVAVKVSSHSLVNLFTYTLVSRVLGLPAAPDSPALLDFPEVHPL